MMNHLTDLTFLKESCNSITSFVRYKSLFHLISKHHEYCAWFLDPLLGVCKSNETPFLVFDT